MDRILRLPEVKSITGLSRASIYKRMARGEFPANRKIGKNARAMGWLQSEIEEYMREIEEQ